MPAVHIPRRAPRGALISLTPMIDVLLILLVFFMVTSSYLELDMIPAIAPEDETATPATSIPDTSTNRLLIRIGADGIPASGGQALPGDALQRLITQRIAANPMLQVTILPVAAATVQALVGAMDAVTLGGATQVRVLRLTAR